MRSRIPDWANWPTEGEREWTLGVEEEVMLLDPLGWNLAQSVEDVLDAMPPSLAAHCFSETHSGVIELVSRSHATVAGAIDDLGELRARLAAVLADLGIRAGCSGTHPFAIAQDMRVAKAERHQAVYGSMRELARREPTFALHVHVGVPDPSAAMAAANQLRAHLPLLLALSANSPFWQGRDTGLASARTPLFQAFPRVGIPRAFSSYAEWAETVDLLVRCEAIPDQTFLWWDVRLQPKFGTVEVRIMDAQASVRHTSALVALVQCIVRLEVLEGYTPAKMLGAQEVIAENRFLAARDGVDAALVDVITERRMPIRDLIEPLLAACEPHARALGCEEELGCVRMLLDEPPAEYQRRLAAEAESLPHMVGALADCFASVPEPVPAASSA